jgi:hypothetical protein
VSLWEQTRRPMTAAQDAVFAESVVVQQSGQSASIPAIFTERFESVELGGEVPVNSTAPVFDVRLDRLPFRPRAGATVTRSSEEFYEVISVEPDGEGGAKLFVVRKRV